ncbi:O-antigen ligase family protein [Altererythrobacter sp. MF3-039]|uniref:O-antigen ligase family protein n=1 Tax=Altererythrobacter sp. MF3-039 TaxID=3252901 RepID=UPI00390C90CB
MLEILPLIVSGFALLAAVFALPGFTLVRWAIVIMALGAGQIYLAFAALGLMLLAENKWQLQLSQSRGAIFATALIILFILGLTVLSPTTFRTYSEGAQLVLYAAVFVLLLSYLSSGTRIMTLLLACVVGAVAVAALAYLTVFLGWQSPPFIFVGRGSNEGSVFLALLGVVPASILFVRTRNPVYLAAAIVLTLVQFTATSRGSVAVSGLAIVASIYFITNVVAVRIAMIVAGGYIFASNLNLLLGIYEAQLNFSARERLVLIEHGWSLFQERFWTGWGWGSTSVLAASAPTINANYPHFHNAYVQFLVELGVTGLVMLVGFVIYCMKGVVSVSFSRRNSSAQALIVISTLAILVASIFDAMLFGADRAVQILFLLALIVRTVDLLSANRNLLKDQRLNLSRNKADQSVASFSSSSST